MTIERMVRVIAGTFVLVSVALALLVSPWFLLFTGFVGANLLQSGITRWCLMEDILKAVGMKRKTEARGDLKRKTEAPGDLKRKTEAPGDLKRKTEAPGDLKREAEAPGDLKRKTEAPGDLKREAEARGDL